MKKKQQKNIIIIAIAVVFALILIMSPFRNEVYSANSNICYSTEDAIAQATILEQEGWTCVVGALNPVGTSSSCLDRNLLNYDVNKRQGFLCTHNWQIETTSGQVFDGISSKNCEIDSDCNVFEGASLWKDQEANLIATFPNDMRCVDSVCKSYYHPAVTTPTGDIIIDPDTGIPPTDTGSTGGAVEQPSGELGIIGIMVLFIAIVLGIVGFIAYKNKKK